MLQKPSGDESDLDKVSVAAPITKKEYQFLNRKLNVLLRRADSFSPTNFQNMIIMHESSYSSLYQGFFLCSVKFDH